VLPQAAVLQAALASLAGAALLLDANLSVIMATAEAETLLGKQGLVGKSAQQLFGDEALLAALASGQRMSLRPPTGARRKVSARVRALFDTNNSESPSGHLVLLEPGDHEGDDAIVQMHGMWTSHHMMKDVFRVLERVAADHVTVLVRGETGTGKELVAGALHALSPRKNGPFRAINCAALPPNLLESELFGHTRGAFTGAVRDVPGHFQLAHGGTIFLDEVAEIPLELQAKLLRVLETRSIVPVGARDPIAVDVRIVSATHRVLRREVEAGRFRADLMYRLRVIPLLLPPLRERGEDVALLTDRFIAEFNASSQRFIEHVSPEARAALRGYDFPGNVRELRNVLQYAFAIGRGPTLLAADLPPEMRSVHEAQTETMFPPEVRSFRASLIPAVIPQASRIPSSLRPPSMASPFLSSPPPPPLRPAPANERDAGHRDATRDVESIRAAIARAGGNRENAAKLLGISRVTLWRRIRALGLG
jgi:transcriptional regulator with PAS, ATPase and Fis domain